MVWSTRPVDTRITPASNQTRQKNQDSHMQTLQIQTEKHFVRHVCTPARNTTPAAFHLSP